MKTVHVPAVKKVTIPVTTEHITLGAFLKLAGVAETGGMAQGMITDGYITVDGAVCTMRGKKLTHGMKVRAFGKNYHVG
jgi:ribosome-associated protein